MACGCNNVLGYSGLYDDWIEASEYTEPYSDGGYLEGFTAGEEWNDTTDIVEISDSFDMDAYDMTQYDPQYEPQINVIPQYTDSLLGSTETFVPYDPYPYQPTQGLNYPATTQQLTSSFLNNLGTLFSLATTGIQTYKMATSDVPINTAPRTGVPMTPTGTPTGISRTSGVLPSTTEPFPSPQAPRIVRTVTKPVSVPMNEKTKAVLILGALAVAGILFLRKK